MVKCVDCGFLTLRNAAAGQLLAADHLYRENGHPSPVGIADIIPLCFMQQRDFRIDFLAMRAAMQEEIIGQRVQIEDHRVMQEVLALDQPQCVEWTVWHLGFTPKEHREMRDRVLAERLDAEVRSAVWAREDRRDAEARHVHYREISVFGLAVIVATIAASIIEGAVGRGWEPSWWPF